MKSKFCYYLLLLVSLNAVSQSQTYVDSNGGFNFLPVSESKQVVDGSPYITDAYLPASIEGYKGVTLPVRYNAQKDEMEFQRDNKKFHVAKSDSLEVKILNKVYKYLEYQVKDDKEQGYLVVVNQGKNHSLFKKEKIILVPASTSGGGYTMDSNAYYRKTNDKFYISVPGKIVYMPTKKKELLSLFPDKSSKLEEYLKKNKVSFDKENDLIGLVNFMNTL